jgi:hypothetical protein
VVIYERLGNCNKFVVSLNFLCVRAASILFFSTSLRNSHFYLFARKINDLTVDLANEKGQSGACVFVEAAGFARKRKPIIFYTLQTGRSHARCTSIMPCGACRKCTRLRVASTNCNELCTFQ